MRKISRKSAPVQFSLLNAFWLNPSLAEIFQQHPPKQHTHLFAHSLRNNFLVMFIKYKTFGTHNRHSFKIISFITAFKTKHKALLSLVILLFFFSFFAYIVNTYKDTCNCAFSVESFIITHPFRSSFIKKHVGKSSGKEEITQAYYVCLMYSCVIFSLFWTFQTI